MTALAAGLLSDRDRQRLTERSAELRDLERMMREPGGLAEAPAPVPLHLAARRTATKFAINVVTEPDINVVTHETAQAVKPGQLA